MPEGDRLYIVKKDWVCVRVEEENWDDSSPLNGKALPTGELPPGANGEVNPAAAIVPGKPPYSIKVSHRYSGRAGRRLTKLVSAVFDVGARDRLVGLVGTRRGGRKLKQSSLSVALF